MSSFVTDVENLLRAQGIEVEQYEWGQKLPATQDLISFIDVVEKPLLQNVKEDDLTRFLDTVEFLQQSTVVWLMDSAQMRSTNPQAAHMIGMARNIRSELAMSFATLELENTGTGAADAVVNVMRKIQGSKDDDSELDIDMEYAWVDGVVNVSRFHWASVDKALCKTAKAPETKGLDIGTPGLLQTLEWTSQPLGKPASDEANVRMVAVGLNFKDIMIAMGIVGGESTRKEGTSPLGLEGTGYVTEVGSEVTNIAIGDRVMLIGCGSVGIATIIQRPAKLCIRIPDQLSDEEAATMPVAYITVLMFLVERWKLEKGQTILIHSAAGGKKNTLLPLVWYVVTYLGVGICAINVAKWVGAKIYATVGSEEKASFLTNEFGIPRNRIFNSRDSTFLNDIMEATSGVGVDLVLNSLSGELLHSSWKCVAPYGAMVEIGKRDMIGRGRLDLAPFEDNRTFLGGEISRLLVTHKATVARLLELTLEQYLKGNFKPITPITTFDPENIRDAFRLMQKGSHTGKIVIKFPPDNKLLLAPTVPLPEFRSDVSYLLVGGLGGLGKAVASWMASCGAKNLMLLSRSAGKSKEDQAFLRELNLLGCSTQCFPCDVTDPVAVKSAIDQASMPIAGAMQMAMVLRDVGVLGMDLESWNAVVRPRVEGTWNLHNLLPKAMDFFVLFSSVSGIFGYYGQANYASANTFLDSFVQYRQDLGLAASVIDIGPFDEVGYVSRNLDTKEPLLANLETLLTEQNFLDTLQLAIARSSTKFAPPKLNYPLNGYQNMSHIVHAPQCRKPIMDPKNGSMWKRDPRMAIYRNIENASASTGAEATDHLKQFLSSITTDPGKLDEKVAADTIAREIGNCVSSFLSKGDGEVDLSLALDAMGVDSLVAIEVRNWWKQNLGVDVSVLELTSAGSVEQLGGLAAKRLKEKYTGK